MDVAQLLCGLKITVDVGGFTNRNTLRVDDILDIVMVVLIVGRRFLAADANGVEVLPSHRGIRDTQLWGYEKR